MGAIKVKQRITINELNKLSDEQKESLREWWGPEQGNYFTDGNRQFVVGNTVRNGDIITYGEDMPRGKIGLSPLLSIGQMIAFINERKPLKSISKARFDKWAVNIETATLGHKDELCDSLWETVTRII